MAGNPEFMTKAEVAELFRTTIRTIERWGAAGKLHPTRVGRTNLYDREEVAALLTQGAPEGVTYHFTPTGKLSKRTAKNAAPKSVNCE